ncbi:venom acid phosphatase Acph-1 isoform X2 [Aethina tumida]|uniref:venom acid phosphatase Acph-1 isoform X2 n=1 Tax=Aethina tumida TaxID=116153 RepID=UPI00096B5F86|nr:venom acid phosphatase Acph-1 isoform X2 [Aethina tumida]
MWHGNRTAHGKLELYPKDPYYNKTYFPIGLGQLTNAGKLKEYQIGVQLRDRYNEFLGETLYPNMIDARSTNYNRTKDSLLYCLAGLSPPTGSEVWSDSLAWQAIPINYWPIDKDEVLYGIGCPNYKKLYEENKYLPKYQAEYDLHKEQFEYISENSGLNVTSFEDIFNLYFGISTEVEFGLEQPEWLKKVWPDIIIELAVKEYHIATATTELRSLTSGYFLKKIVQDSKNKIKEDPDDEFKKKLYLYSAHETNISHLLITLGVFDEIIPNYGSYVIFELHKISGVYGLKIYYQNYESSEPKLMKLPGCDEFCPLDQFNSLYEEYFPIENACGY